MKSPSLRAKLTFFIISLLFIACTITTSISYFELNRSLKQVFDSQQLLFAKRLAALNIHGRMMVTLPLVQIDADELDNLDYDGDALAFAIFNRQGEMLLNDGEDGRKFEFNGGFFSSANNQAMIYELDKWRVLWLLSNDNRSVIAVGQKLDYQQAILIDLMVKQLIPWLITFIIMIILVILIISRGFHPIRLLTQKIIIRQPDDASAISSDGVPKEIIPFVLSLNHLFSRISTMITQERLFISDAAHELRTPLAALRVQTEVAQLSDDDEQTRINALNNLISGIDRATHLVDQLLVLSRLDTMQIKTEIKSVCWQTIIHHVIDELSPLIEQKQIHIEIISPAQHCYIDGHPLLLSILVKNLVTNAIRYIPKGFCIIITIDNSIIRFEDNGPGVAPEVLARLGERFYRPAGLNEEGSGLGLSIVKKIAQLHHISVQFNNRPEGGFSVNLRY